jgi:ribosomal protein S18 acetylase RimI-like enzyme
MSRDQAAWDRMLESMDVFFRTVPASSEAGRVIELDGVLATVTPAVPERSLPNSVVYREEDALEAALDELTAAYEEAGVLAWTVWVPEYHQRVRALLESAGHTLDATPTAMIAGLEDLDPPREDDPEPDPHPTAEDVGRINDLAYGTGDAFQRILGSGPADPAFTYIARVEGEPAASVITNDHEGDCSVWWVATVPEARGRGLAPGLMRRALADGRARGCEVTTLQATKLGAPVYERLGYRSLGVIEMWERRASP